MPERRFDTGYWNDPDIMKLPFKAKLLYAYLWTNRHCNQAGLYEIAVETISFETGLPADELPDLINLLEKKVTWIPEQNLVWVKNFLHRQSKSPKFLAAAAKCLSEIGNNGLVQEVIAYNERYTLSIPYPYGINRVAVPSTSTSLSHSNASSDSLSDKGGGLGEGEVKLTEEDQEIIAVWSGVRGFRMEVTAIAELLEKLKADFPDVDILSESKKWSVSKITQPLGQASNPSSQIYNFISKRHEWNQEGKQRGQQRESYPMVRCKCGYTGPDVGHKTCPVCHQPYEKEEKKD